MASRKGPSKTSRSDGGKRKRAKRRKAAEDGRGQVFPFRLVLGEEDDQPAVDPATQIAAKDETIKQAWRYLKRIKSSQLAYLLPVIAHYGRESDECHRIELDSGDLTRDALLEEVWSYLRAWDLIALIKALPTFVEMALENDPKGRVPSPPDGRGTA